MADLLDRIPAPVRSLWKAEIALRRGLWASVLHRNEANPHYEEARQHWNDAIKGTPDVSNKSGEWGGRDHVAATVDQDRVEKQADKQSGGNSAP